MVPRLFKLFFGSIGLIFLVFIVVFIAKREHHINERIQHRMEIWQAKEHFIQNEMDSVKKSMEIHEESLNDKYKGRTVLSDTELLKQEYFPNDKHAIVTVIPPNPNVINAQWLSCIAMIQSLRESGTRVPNIVIMINDDHILPKVAMDTFKRLNTEIIRIPSLDSSYNIKVPDSWGNFTSMHVWTLSQFDKILYVDPTSIVIHNIDHLLLEPDFTAAPAPIGCSSGCLTATENLNSQRRKFVPSSGLFVLKPSLDIFMDMVNIASNNPPNNKEAWSSPQEMISEKFNDNWNNNLGWQYDVPVGTCMCNSKKNSTIFTYRFYCIEPLTPPYYDPFISIFTDKIQKKQSKEDDTCPVAIYNLWFKLLAKGFNFHEMDESLEMGAFFGSGINFV